MNTFAAQTAEAVNGLTLALAAVIAALLFALLATYQGKATQRRNYLTARRDARGYAKRLIRAEQQVTRLSNRLRQVTAERDELLDIHVPLSSSVQRHPSARHLTSVDGDAS